MFNFQALVYYDPTIMDGVQVPEGIDAEILKSEIMLQCGLLQPLFPEAAVMKAAIAQWFAARQWTFTHLINIIQAEYSPIENTDRYDATTRTIARSLGRSDSSAENTTGSLTRGTESSVNTSGENIGQVSAFNSSDWSNSDRNSSSGNTDGTEDVTENRTGSGTKTATGSETENSTDTFTQHMHGNIGVTTNQEMITQELALLKEFNIYYWIAINLRDSLFLEVY